jgi:phage regulator Rha-like protein
MQKSLIKADIQNKVFNIRGVNVMLDRDLAALYGVETKNLNRAVKHNIERFPPEFMFQLNDRETAELVQNLHRFASLKHSSSNPYAFTEHGVAMLSSVLKSKRAISINIQIINTFVSLRHYALKASSGNAFTNRLVVLEKALLAYMEKNDKRVDDIILALNALIEEPPQKEVKRIGFVRDRKLEK